jgi:hypothetical protein
MTQRMPFSRWPATSAMVGWRVRACLIQIVAKVAPGLKRFDSTQLAGTRHGPSDAALIGNALFFDIFK